MQIFAGQWLVLTSTSFKSCDFMTAGVMSAVNGEVCGWHQSRQCQTSELSVKGGCKVINISKRNNGTEQQRSEFLTCV